MTTQERLEAKTTTNTNASPTPNRLSPPSWCSIEFVTDDGGNGDDGYRVVVLNERVHITAKDAAAAAWALDDQITEKVRAEAREAGFRDAERIVVAAVTVARIQIPDGAGASEALTAMVEHFAKLAETGIAEARAETERWKQIAEGERTAGYAVGYNNGRDDEQSGAPWETRPKEIRDATLETGRKEGLALARAVVENALNKANSRHKRASEAGVGAVGRKRAEADLDARAAHANMKLCGWLLRKSSPDEELVELADPGEAESLGWQSAYKHIAGLLGCENDEVDEMCTEAGQVWGKYGCFPEPEPEPEPQSEDPPKDAEPVAGDTGPFWEAVEDVADFVHEWADGCRGGRTARDAVAVLRDPRWKVTARPTNLSTAPATEK